jgi:hypothetical protein
MLGIGHFALIRTYSKDARQGRTTQGFGVFCCLLTATALGRVTTSCADQRANWGEMRKYGKKGGEVSTLALKGWRVYVAPK